MPKKPKPINAMDSGSGTALDCATTSLTTMLSNAIRVPVEENVTLLKLFQPVRATADQATLFVKL